MLSAAPRPGGGLGSVLQPPALGWVTWETRELLPVITLVLLPLSSNAGMEGGMEGLSRPCIGGGSAPWVGALWGTHGRATRAVPTPLKLGGESGAAGAPFGFFIVTSMILSLCFLSRCSGGCCIPDLCDNRVTGSRES